MTSRTPRSHMTAARLKDVKCVYAFLYLAYPLLERIAPRVMCVQ